ncbi:Protein YIPF3 [Frankliniella fusca]|uniref:Protein YIPF3 n=1 Tax=Frankliniella fusca TaxID=407009 RepID=A0AAE1HMY9_9NEOP|nr:Protein YIPF3 [Frankliniella fusca]
MDFFRRILFRLLHDERVIHKLSETRPIRIVARICASLFMEGKAIAQDPALKKLDPKAIKEAASGLSQEIVKTTKEGKDAIKEAIEKIKDLKNRLNSKPLGVLEKGMWVDFVENNDKARRISYGRLTNKDYEDWYGLPKKSWVSIISAAFSDALMLFAVSPFELPVRIARSMLPPIVHRFRIINVDLLGPSLAVLILLCLLFFRQTEKENTLGAERVVLSYCILLPIVTHLILKFCQAAITFMQLLSLIGYSLYGPALTLSVSLLIDPERSNTIFFLCLSVFGGLSTLRVVLVLLASLRIPVARLLICTSVALTQLLFVVWLHFTYFHPTFVFGRGKVVNING